MRTVECPNCGSNNIGIDKIDSTGIDCECYGCTYRWAVPDLKTKIKRALTIRSCGMVYEGGIVRRTSGGGSHNVG